MASQNVDPRAQVRNPRKEKKKTGVGSKANSVTQRLHSELMKLMTSGIKGVSAFPDGDNIFKWIGTIEGPKDSIYEGLTYKLSLEFPSNYPFSAPTVKFVTPCFHPNFDLQGNICLDILKEKWSPVLNVSSLLLSIQSLFEEPNNDSPLNVQAADLWVNQVAYKKKLHEHYDKEVRNKST